MSGGEAKPRAASLTSHPWFCFAQTADSQGHPAEKTLFAPRGETKDGLELDKRSGKEDLKYFGKWLKLGQASLGEAESMEVIKALRAEQVQAFRDSDAYQNLDRHAQAHVFKSREKLSELFKALPHDAQKRIVHKSEQMHDIARTQAGLGRLYKPEATRRAAFSPHLGRDSLNLSDEGANTLNQGFNNESLKKIEGQFPMFNQANVDAFRRDWGFDEGSSSH